MDIGHPVRSVVPTLDGPVLVALAGTNAPLSLVEVHRLAAAGSISGVRRVLLRLVRTGLVLDVPGGYVLNRSHVAARAVEELANLHAEVTHRVRRAVEEWGGAADLVALVGSAGRRDGDEASDIDIVIVSDAADSHDFADDLAEWVQQWTGNNAQVVVLGDERLRQLRHADPTLLRAWNEDMVVISGSPACLAGVA